MKNQQNKKKLNSNNETTEEKLAEGFVKGVFEIVELKKQNEKLQEMFDMQVKLVTALELEKMELQKKIDILLARLDLYHNNMVKVVDNMIDKAEDLLKNEE